MFTPAVIAKSGLCCTIVRSLLHRQLNPTAPSSYSTDTSSITTNTTVLLGPPITNIQIARFIDVCDCVVLVLVVRVQFLAIP